jgi:hypothetical protein
MAFCELTVLCYLCVERVVCLRLRRRTQGPTNCLRGKREREVVVERSDPSGARSRSARAASHGSTVSLPAVKIASGGRLDWIVSAAVLPDRVYQAVEIKRFGKVGRSVQLTRPLAGRRQHQDRNVGDIGILTLTRAKLEPVHHRHHQIEQDHVRTQPVSQLIEGITAVDGSLRRKTLPGDELRHHLARVVVVFHDQHVTSHTASGRCKKVSAGEHWTIGGVIF